MSINIQLTTLIIYFQHDISTFFESEGDKFDCVYDACTNSGAGEDYKDKVIFACLLGFCVLILVIMFQSIALLKTDGQYVAINGSASMWLR